MTSSTGSQVCRWLEEVPGYVLGEMTARQKAEFEKHLASCPVCRKAVDSAVATVGRLRSMPAEACSPDLVAKVMAALPAGQCAESRSVMPLRMFLRVAASIAVITCAVYVLFRAGEEKRALGPAVAAVPRAAASVHRDAMDWLCSAQKVDGSWPAGGGTQEQYSVGVSALALLALMEDGRGAVNGSAGVAVRRGLGRLVELQDREGLVGPRFSGTPYNHGLAAFALCNACLLESNTTWRVAADKAIDLIRETQDPAGGWGYLGASPGAVNTSISIWPLLALMRAEELGMQGLRPAIDRGLTWLATTINKDGFMGYERVNNAPAGFNTLTAAGAACLLRDHGRSGAMAARAMLPAIQGVAGQVGQTLDFYRTFFVAEALSLAPGATSDRIRSSIREELIALQNRTGPAAGSWSAGDRWGPVGGPVYATALASLSLR